MEHIEDPATREEFRETWSNILKDYPGMLIYEKVFAKFFQLAFAKGRRAERELATAELAFMLMERL